MPTHTPWGRDSFATLVLTLLALGGCGGPQPLSVAIDPADQASYQTALVNHPGSPRDAYFAWKSGRTGRSVTTLREADEAIVADDNPFDARNDPAAVSAGAVIYVAHCARCHGDAADGRGPDMKQPLPKMDFHSLAKRFAVTVHHGAPSTWFAKVHDGYVSQVVNADGSANAMPPFGPTMSREQIWLTITYLQSLDADAVARGTEDGR